MVYMVGDNVTNIENWGTRALYYYRLKKRVVHSILIKALAPSNKLTNMSHTRSLACTHTHTQTEGILL